jgi:hypothetical protein
MKIRAKLPNGNYFIEVTDKELGNLINEVSASYKREVVNAIDKAISQEIDIPICNLYKKREYMNDMLRNNEIKKVANRLKEISDVLSPFNDVVKQIDEDYNDKILKSIENNKQ